MHQSPFAKLRRNKNFKVAGYGLIEANVAIAMVGMFISGLAVVNSNVLGMLRTMKESTGATQALQERVEQMRIANWVQITDSSYVAGSLLNSGTSSSDTLANTTETMTVTAYPDPSIAGTLKVKRSKTGIQTISSSSSLKDARMIKVNIDLTWEGAEKRPHTRATATLIAKGGITK